MQGLQPDEYKIVIVRIKSYKLDRPARFDNCVLSNHHVPDIAPYLLLVARTSSELLFMHPLTGHCCIFATLIDFNYKNAQ
jgi:hypothetical protein